MIVAIYARKSRYSDAGESIENQISMCKEYANIHYDNKCIFYEFRDEGFSGSNTNRPAFKELLKDLKNYDTLICYRLDRISRNVSDFSIFLRKLEDNKVSFVSIKECFDTSTPMGRAMIHIASVFSQLERETITERIKDNKYKLARLGTWQGGVVPLGYKAKRISYIEKGKKRAYHVLVPDETSKHIVEKIFSLYIKYKNFAEVSRQLENIAIHAPKGGTFARSSLRNIITNPVYAKNSVSVYNYLQTQGMDISTPKAYFDGEGGLIGYLKTSSNIGQNPKDKWIIACRETKGIINGNTWIKANKLIQQKTRTYFSKNALLSSIIYCEKCNSKMYVKGNRVNKKGEYSFYYRCPNCNLSFNGTILDKNIWEFLNVNFIKKCYNKSYNLLIKEKASVSQEISLEIQKLFKNILFDFDSLPTNIKRRIFLSIISKVTCSEDKISIYIKP